MNFEVWKLETMKFTLMTSISDWSNFRPEKSVQSVQGMYYLDIESKTLTSFKLRKIRRFKT